jgi:hypothetical protein
MATRRNPDEMTDVQEAFWKGLTDQRVARMWAVADDWDDLSHEAKEFLRSAKPETLTFLKDAREAEIKELENGIELVRSFKTTGRVLKWAIISTATVLTAVIAIKSWLIGK